MANLKKDLESYTDYKDYKESKDIKEATLLLESSTINEKKEILEKLGIDHDCRDAQRLVDKNNALKHISESYESNVYTNNTIVNIAHKYSLLLVRIDNYKGKVLPEMVEDIENFCKKHDKILSYKNFYLLIPEELTFKGSSKKYPNYKPCLFYLEKRGTRDWDIELSDLFILLENYNPNFSSLRIISNIFKSEEFTKNSRNLKKLRENIIFYRCLLLIFFLINIFITLLGVAAFGLAIITTTILGLVISYHQYNFQNYKILNRK